jgi:multidrug efflux pump subunit AcrA (membrane-fusion protein)
MKPASWFHTLAWVALAGLWPGALSAHGGKIEVGENAKGPVRLTPTQERALGLTLAAAAPRPMSDVLYLNGEVRPVAGRPAQASSRIAGQGTQVYATIGQYVRAGQRLARVQSRLVGDPPPSADILAPMSGTIEQASVSVGQAIEPSTSLFAIRDSREVSVVARVYEEDLGKVQVGQDTTIEFISYPGKKFAGRIQLLGPSLDPLTRTVDVWVSVGNDEGILRPNLFARVGVVLRQADAALTVPTAAVIEANGERFVFVKQPTGYVRTEIETGVRDSQLTEVAEGLAAGDKVVVQGNRQVYTLWLTGGAPIHDEDD